MQKTDKKTVFVGLSGGVDSSVAALRLIQQGYNVFGVFIKVWHPDFLVCSWEEERLDAMRVASKLGIPFLTCDAEKAYRDEVAQYFIEGYKAGTTPNPDVMCNKYVKFGAFLSFALEQGADYIATGHYAQNSKETNGYSLLRGVDTNKDQSYFLWTLTQEQLSHVLLPVGDSTKDIIRLEAQRNGLITADKKDSQGICFLGQVDIPEFLSHYVTLQSGDVLDIEGNTIGIHKGALVYTTGQRHGFIITKESAARTPHYVVSRDIAHNTITVDTKPPFLKDSSIVTLTQVNYIAFEPKVGDSIEIQTRYRQKPQHCSIEHIGENSLTLKLIENGEETSTGQSCVLYDKKRCCGGGIITT